MLMQSFIRVVNRSQVVKIRNIRTFSLTQNASNTIIHIPRADVYRFGDGNKVVPVFKDLEWTVNDGENWAIIGPAGSAKSDLLDMLLGYMRLSPAPRDGLYPFLYNRPVPLDAHGNVSTVSFTTRKRFASRGFVDYSARYGAMWEDDRQTLRETLFSEVKTPADITELDTLAERLDLKELLDLPFIVLSNGQTRRARIAKALLSRPELLLLDEPLTGLDVQHRPKLTNLLRDIHVSRKPRILMALRPQDPLPEWITHIALVNGQYVRSHRRSSTVEVPHYHFLSSVKEKRKAEDAAASLPKGQEGERRELVSMKNVNVRYQDRHVLKNINWTIREGEKWTLQGANGSGKTTLLSILTGAHPQSYTQRPSPSHPSSLTLFSKPRHTQPTMTLQRLIGHASPEIYAAFPRRLGEGTVLSVREAVATGFEGSFVYCMQRRTPEELKRVDSIIKTFLPDSSDINRANNDIDDAESERDAADFESFVSRPFALLSPGEQSLVLLMRALVARPPLVILDEVFSGMDARMIDRARLYLRQELEPHQAVVFVTHWEEEVPWDRDEGLRRIMLVNGEARIDE